MGAAAQTPVLSNAERLAGATGMAQLLADAQATNTAGIRAQADILYEQFEKAGLSQPMLLQLRPRVEEMMRRVNQAWDPNEATRIYSEHLGAALSQQEIDEAEIYYASPQGRKTFAAIGESQKATQRYIAAKTNEALQVEMAGLITEMKRLATDNAGR